MHYSLFFLRRFGKKALFFFAFLSIFRLAFHLIYFSYFATEPFQVFVVSYIHGLRFDAVVIFYSLGVLWLIEYLVSTAHWGRKKFFRLAFFALEACVLTFFVVLGLIDFVFFSFFGRHLKNDFSELATNGKETFVFAINEYWPLLLLTVLLIALVVFAYWRLLYKKPSAPPVVARKRSYLAGFLTLFILFVLLARGGWQEQPYIWQDSILYNTAKGGNLTTGPLFNVYALIWEQNLTDVRLLPEAQAEARVQTILDQKGTHFLDPYYPVYREFDPSKTVKNYNVVFLVLESFLAEMIGSYDPAFKDLTPNFDALVKQGLWFPNFWSSGPYTNNAYAALLYGFPTLKNLAVFGSKFGNRNFPNLFQTFQTKGYYTLSVQPYPNGSSNVSDYLLRDKIDLLFNQEDFSPAEIAASDIAKGAWGIRDDFVFHKFFAELKKAPEPFLGILHNATTHVPFDLNLAEWAAYGTKDLKSKQKNALRYMDHYLGEFIKQLRQEKFGKNTVVFILGDHTILADQTNYANRARVPLLILMPDQSLKGINPVYGSQTDIIPTLYDLLGMKARLSAFGTSLFQKDLKTAFAFHSDTKENIWIEDGKLILMDQATILGYYDLGKDPNTKNNLYPKVQPDPAVLEHYKAYIQTAQNLLIADRIAPNTQVLSRREGNSGR